MSGSSGPFGGRSNVDANLWDTVRRQFSQSAEGKPWFAHQKWALPVKPWVATFLDRLGMLDSATGVQSMARTATDLSTLTDPVAPKTTPITSADPANLTVTMVGTSAVLNATASPTVGVASYSVFRRSPATGAAFVPGVDTPIATGVTLPYVDPSLTDGDYEWEIFGELPAPVASPSIWFDPTGAHNAGGGVIDTWTDSVSGLVLTAPVGQEAHIGVNTIGGQPTVTFDISGSGDTLYSSGGAGGAVALTDQNTVYMVMTVFSGGVNPTAVFGNNVEFVSGDSGTYMYPQGPNTLAYYSNAAVQQFLPHLFCFTTKDPSNSYRVNTYLDNTLIDTNTVTSAEGPNNTGDFAVGSILGGNQCNCAIALIAVYPTLHTPTQRLQMYNWAKYAYPGGVV